MKAFLFIATVAAILGSVRVADAGVSIQVGQPGFCGSIDIGGFPQTQLVYPQPVVIEPVPSGVVQEPIYLHVPPGHAKHWRKHCGKYHACGQPVYFVKDSWYRNESVPRYRKTHGRHSHVEDHHHGKGHDYD